ncbi:MAG: calcium/sodium antiporter [Candidatus Diapherotrites archaeon]
MILYFLFVFAAFFLLMKSSDLIVGSASRIARIYGISELVIGLTIIAIGTSLPELSSSLISSFAGSGGIAVGNIVGANIANISLILGLSSVIAGAILIPREVFSRELMIMFLASFIFMGFAFDGVISFYESLLLFAGFIAYMFFLLKIQIRVADFFSFHTYLNLFKPETLIRSIAKSFKKALLLELGVFGIGLIGLYLGALILIDGIKGIAFSFGFHESLIAATLMSLGTTVPELFVSITAIKKGLNNIMVGNIIGSNTVNILMVVGAAGIVSPLLVPLKFELLLIPFMFFVSLLLVIFTFFGFRISRAKGFVLLLSYFLFLFLALGR